MANKLFILHYHATRHACLACCSQPAMLLLAGYIAPAFFYAASLPTPPACLYMPDCLYCAGLPLRCQTASMPPACLNATGLSLCHRCYCSLLIIIVYCLCMQSFSFSLYITGPFFTFKIFIIFSFFQCAVEVYDFWPIKPVGSDKDSFSLVRTMGISLCLCVKK